MTRFPKDSPEIIPKILMEPGDTYTKSVMKTRKVLVSGGAGYIGTQCCIELLGNGYEVVCADNFINSSPKDAWLSTPAKLPG